MTAGTGVGYSEGLRQVRAWDSQAVIAPVVDTHIACRHHMTGNTGCTGGTHWMKMVLRRVIDGGAQCREFLTRRYLVTLRANGVAREFERCAVRIVAIGACHPTLVHFALQKRTIDVNLIRDLAIDVVEVGHQQRW